MKALRKVNQSAGFVLVDLPEPSPNSHEVKIRVLRTGICGTDLHIKAWDEWAQKTLHLPLTPGHEFSGVVVEVGSEVSSVKVGDIASGEGHIVCNLCRNCRAGRRHLCMNTVGIGVNRDGAFSEYICLPESNVWKHDPNIDLDLAAIFDPLGNAVHVALSFPLVGEDVLITGAGPIGLMAAQVARFVGARYIVITDISDDRLELARSMGVDVAVNVHRENLRDVMPQLGMTEGFDVAFEMSGSSTALPQILDVVGHGARIALLGLPTKSFEIDWAKVITNMITIKGIYGREMFETWYAMTAMIKKGLAISPVITHKFPYTEWEEAFEIASRASAGKVVLDWSSSD
jgi:threonine 3-dehydrogenase